MSPITRLLRSLFASRSAAADFFWQIWSLSARWRNVLKGISPWQKKNILLPLINRRPSNCNATLTQTFQLVPFFWDFCHLESWDIALSLMWGKKSVTAPVRRGLEGQGGILMRRGGRGFRSIGTCVPHMCDTCSIRCLGATKNALGGNSALPHVYRSGCLLWRVKDSHTCPKFFLPHQKLCASCANCVYTL